jgi:hypothetical protein
VKDLNRVLRELKGAALREFPNPERLGCPGSDVIAGLARRTLPATHPGAEHITHCSPCYGEFLVVRREIRRALFVRIAGIAAACLLAVAAATYVALQRFRVSRPQPVEQAATSLTTDLRPYSQNRGLGDNPAPSTLGPLRVPRKRLRWTLQLPVGADEGLYTLDIRDDTQKIVVEKQTAAALQDQVLTAVSDVDLTNVAPGRYELALGTGKDGWRTYPLVVE